MIIMVIDDELISRKKLVELLKPYGECKEFDRGDIALIAYETAIKENRQIDLITIDIFMPHLNGLAVLRKIREIEEDAGIPPERKAKIVMVTSNDDKNKVIEALSMGCNDYILKPFNEEEVVFRLKRLNIIAE